MIRPGGGTVAALNQVSAVFNELSSTSLRLSTLSRVNSAYDDPAALIASEQLRDELAVLEAASRNTSRASSVIRLADSGLSQVGDLLREVRANVVSAGDSTLSLAEREALQIETDAALEAINLVGSYTSYGDTRLLDGSNLELSFALSGDPGNVAKLELLQVSSETLGSEVGTLNELASGGAANLIDGNLTLAAGILDAAGDEVLLARARLGAFEKYTLETTSRVIDTAFDNLSVAISRLVDVNVAAESSRLVRAQILGEVSIAALRTASTRENLVQSLLGRWLARGRLAWQK